MRGREGRKEERRGKEREEERKKERMLRGNKQTREKYEKE